MEQLHGYFNLLSGVFDLVIAVAIVIAARKLAPSPPRLVWVLAGFFVISGLGYLNEPNHILGTHVGVAIGLDIARIVALGVFLLYATHLARALVATIEVQRYQEQDREQARRDQMNF